MSKHKIDKILEDLDSEAEAMELLYSLLNTLTAEHLKVVRRWLNKNGK